MIRIYGDINVYTAEEVDNLPMGEVVTSLPLPTGWTRQNLDVSADSNGQTGLGSETMYSVRRDGRIYFLIDSNSSLATAELRTIGYSKQEDTIEPNGIATLRTVYSHNQANGAAAVQEPFYEAVPYLYFDGGWYMLKPQSVDSISSDEISQLFTGSTLHAIGE